MIVALMLAAGAAWEPAALRVLEQQRDVVLLKRCVDADDLAAAASAGQAGVAVVAVGAPGLDRASVDALSGHGLAVVAIVGAGDERARDRAQRVGVTCWLPDSEITGLPDLLRTTTSTPRPVPAVPAPALAGPVVEQSPATPGRVLAVWGPAGAPGRSTVAAGLTSVLAGRHRRVMLVDADPYGGSIAQRLGILDEVSGLLAAARLASTGDLAERLGSVQRGLAGRFTVVTGLPRADRWREVRPGVLEDLLVLARASGDVVVDTGFSLESEPDADLRPGGTRQQLTLEALASADDVIAVGGADPVALARLARGLVDLREVRPDHDRVVAHVVVNRMRPSLGWSEREVADMIASFAPSAALHFLPDDRTTADRCLVAGRSLTEVGETPLGRAMGRLADAL